MGINVLSLFGGIECGRVAIDRLGWKVDRYFSSEIDPYPIKVSSANYPDIVHIGNVKDVSFTEFLCYGSEIRIGRCEVDKIDLLIGGSPCQDLSIAKSGGKGLEGEKSGLFYEYVRILREVKPKYFLLENVASMKQVDRDKITDVLREVYPDTEVHMINSSLVSAQNRKRLYWTNIKGITQPEDKGIRLEDVLEEIPMYGPPWSLLEDKYITEKLKTTLEDRKYGIYQRARGKNKGGIVQNGLKAPTVDAKGYRDNNFIVGQFRRGGNLRIHADQEKSCAITANMGTGGKNVPILVNQEYFWRKLTPIECERLQNLPDNYTSYVSDSRRYKAIGNGWTVDVIAHILSFAKF